MKIISESLDSFGIPILLEARGEGSIYTLLLFNGCSLPEILHCSHFATDDLTKLDDIIAVLDEYFKDGVEARELEFNDPAVLGKEDQPILKLTDGNPYRDLHDKLSGIAKYKYPEFIPHVSVTSNVESFKGKTASLVVSCDGKEIKRYSFVTPWDADETFESIHGVNEFGIPIEEMRTKQFKIDGKEVECILMAGGQGFKIYAIPGEDTAWLLVAGRNKTVVPEKDPKFQTIANYVNLRYHPANMQDQIKKDFMELVSKS